jgi:hypothetical protein
MREIEMKKAALLVSLLLTLFIAPLPSHAVEHGTVQTLLGRCESNNFSEQAVCQGYILGIAGVLGLNCRYLADGYSMPDFMTAETDGLTPGAAVQGFKNWARANPQNWSLSEFTGVIVAMGSSFPCKH